MSFIREKWDDIVYVLILLAAIALGAVYRKIREPEHRKWFGTVVGISLIVLVSGFSAIHAFLSTAIGIILIYTTGKGKCHVATIVFMFLYLFFYRALANFGLPVPSGHANLIQMILTLKMVGMAFEINGSYLAQGKEKKQDDLKTEEYTKDVDYDELIDPSAMDIVHYMFSYVAILTGPYFRYRTYDDFIHCNYYKYADCGAKTLDKLKYLPLHIIAFLILNHIWPISYVMTEEFANRSIWFKVSAMWIFYTTFRHRIYAGLKLAEGVCISAGLGAYPSIAKSSYGHGPKYGYRRIKNLSDVELAKCSYDFETIKSIDAWSTDFNPSFRESMKVWNCCVQYWLGMYVYRRFPIKPLRAHVTLLISSAWHGWYSGYFFCLYIAPFYLYAEDILNRLFIKEATGIKLKVYLFISWIIRMHYQGYAATAFLLLEFPKVWRYYSLVYHHPYVIYVIVLIIGLIVQQRDRKKRKMEAVKEAGDKTAEKMKNS